MLLQDIEVNSSHSLANLHSMTKTPASMIPRMAPMLMFKSWYQSLSLTSFETCLKKNLCENAIKYQRFLNECSYGVFVGQENDQDHHHGDGTDQVQHKVDALKKL